MLGAQSHLPQREDSPRGDSRLADLSFVTRALNSVESFSVDGLDLRRKASIMYRKHSMVATADAPAHRE